MKGFTLVETLIAAAIAVIVMSLGLAITVGLGKTAESCMRQDEFVQSVRVALDQISQDVSCAYRPAPPGAKPNFSGASERRGEAKADRLDFVSTRGVGSGKGEYGGALVEIGYSLDTEHGRLLRREQVLPDDDFRSGGPATAIAENVESFSCQYYDGSRWVEDWDGEERGILPRGVRVLLTMRGAAGAPARRFSTTVALPLGVGGEEVETRVAS